MNLTIADLKKRFHVDECRWTLWQTPHGKIVIADEKQRKHCEKSRFGLLANYIGCSAKSARRHYLKTHDAYGRDDA